MHIYLIKELLITSLLLRRHSTDQWSDLSSTFVSFAFSFSTQRDSETLANALKLQDQLINRPSRIQTGTSSSTWFWTLPEHWWILDYT